MRSYAGVTQLRNYKIGEQRVEPDRDTPLWMVRPLSELTTESFPTTTLYLRLRRG